MNLPIAPVTIIVALLIGIIAAWLLARSGLRPPRWLVPTAAGLGMAGLGLVMVSSQEVDSALARRHWPTVPATVLESRLEGERAFHALVIYEYAHDGASIVDTCRIYQPSFGGKRKRHEVAKHLLAPYVPGAAVTAYVDPSACGRSTLDVAIPWSIYGQSGLGGVLVALGSCLIVLHVWSPHRHKP